MKALVLEGAYNIRYQEVPNPKIKEDEVLIRVKACAICGSDLHGYDGTSNRRVAPIIMGHEASGDIVRIGDRVTGWSIGTRVTFDSTDYCGDCYFCKNGKYNLCLNRKIVGVSCESYRKNGAMAEYIAIKAHMLYEIPPLVSYQEACLAEPLAVGMHAAYLSGVEEGDTVVIIGAGTIGLMTLLASQKAKKKIIIARYPYQKEFALQLGAETVVMDGADTIDVVREKYVGTLGCNIVYDTVGSQSSLDTAFSLVQKGGKIVCIGNGTGQVVFPLQQCVVGQISVLGSYSSAGEFRDGLEAVASGKIDLQPFLGNCYPLEMGEQAFVDLSKKKKRMTKVILEP